MHPKAGYRALADPADRSLVAGFYRRAEDYIRLETGQPPCAATLDAYFYGAPPGHDPALDLREGLFCSDRLEGLAELAFALPRPDCAMLTLMILAPEARGQGLGRAWTERLCQIAAKRGAKQICLSVLRRNPRGLSFWRQAGFTEDRSVIRSDGRHALSRCLLSQPLPS